MPETKPADDRLKISCSSCKQRMDVTDLEPFTKIKCVNCGASLIVPKRLQQFALLGRMGKGGMGSVFRALDTSLNRQVAIKLMSKELADNPAFVESFSREARAAAALNHHNIAQIYSFGHDHGQYFLAMELLDKGSLQELITKEKKLTEAQVIEIGLQVTVALKAASARGLVHQDIKPANILFNEEGIAKIVDFGLAQFSEAGKSTATSPMKGIWGTAEYIAPEKLENKKHDFRSDMYSLGVTMYQTLAGRLPFEGESPAEIAHQRLKVIPPSVQKLNPDVSDRTAAILTKMMARNPDERYQNYDELLTAMTAAKRTVVQGLNRVAAAKSDASRMRRARLRNRLLQVAALLLLVMGGLWVLRNLDTVAKIPGVGDLLTFIRTPTDTPPPPSPHIIPKDTPPVVVIKPPETVPSKSWQSLFDVAVGHLAAGNYAQARDDCDAMINLPNSFGGSEAKKNMTFCLRGQAQLLQGLATEGQNSFTMLAGTTTLAEVPVELPRELVPVLIAQVIVGKFPQEKLVASLDNLSSGARALVRFSLAVKNLGGTEKEQADAKQFFGDFLAAPQNQEEDWKWVERLRPAATRLQKEYGLLVTALDEAKQLRDKEKWQEAMDRLLPAQIQPPLTTTAFLARADKQRTDYQTEWDSRKAAQTAKLAEQIENEKKLFGQTEADVTRLNQQTPYSFAPAVEAFKKIAPQITSDEIKVAIQKKIDLYQLLADLKAQMFADIAKKPLPANQLTLRSKLMPDALVRCTEIAAIFQSEYGESTVYWKAIPPTEFSKIVRYYLPTLGASADKSAQEAVARRYLALAVFYAELKVDASESHNLAVAAATLYPPYKETVRHFFPNIE